MFKADLHMHSTFSDGVLTPGRLLEECLANGIELMALTDHDTFAGSDTLRGKTLDLPVIPGVELSMADRHGLHLLAYGQAEGRQLRETVQRLAVEREKRADRMLERLEALGMPISGEELRKQCSGTVGRPHIARAMVRLGYVGCMQEAFEKYLGNGKPAYVAGRKLTMTEALPLVRESGFIPVLAHPCELQLELTELEPMLRAWKDKGLMGMEVYHPSAASVGYLPLDHMARRLGLLVTGGSDFHQAHDKHGMIGCTCDAWQTA